MSIELKSSAPFHAPSPERIGAPAQGRTRIIAVSSGAIGVGKTSIASNAAIALQGRRFRVLILDAEPGPADVSALFALRAASALPDVARRRSSIAAAIMRGPGGVDILSVGPNIGALDRLDKSEGLLFLDLLTDLDGRYDLILIDARSGASPGVVFIHLAAQATLIVITPAPETQDSALELIRDLHANCSRKRFHILINRSRSEVESRDIFKQFAEAADQNLGDVSLGYLGCLSEDSAVPRAAELQRSIIEQEPGSAFARDIQTLGYKMMNLPIEELAAVQGLFWRRRLETIGSEEGGAR